MKQSVKFISLLILFALVLGACAPGTAAPAVGDQSKTEGDANAPITVWIDTTRQAAVDAYKKANPDKAALIKEEIVDRGQFPSKVLLFNNTNKGWPDVVFAEPSIVGQVADAAHNYPLDLKEYVSEDMVKGYGNGLTPCWFDGKLFCLRNDVAQNVLYYNKKLMDEFGYTVPTTWEEYQELSDKVAAEHPGYIMGAFNDGWNWAVYFWASSCPMSEVVSMSQVRINPDHPGCARAANLVDHMIANGTIAKLDPFDPAFVQIANDNKLLMLIDASWFGEYIFGGKPDSLYYKTAENQLGTAAPLKWKDEAAPVTATHGGSAWTVSRHTKNPKLAVEFALFVTSADDYQATGPTFPAYLPVADKWAKTIQSNPLYANDPYPIFKDAVQYISPLDKQPRYDWISVVQKWMRDANQGNKTQLEVLKPMAEELQKLAEAQGYEVVK
jgi:ABC-type glycerol-3-phosphate transport system substrate-binding protein